MNAILYRLWGLAEPHREYLSFFWDYLRVDGMKHLILSAIGVAIMKRVISLKKAIFIVALIGIAREAINAGVFNPRKFDMHDIVCDVIGILIGAL